jgi:pyridinium-3,5-bisthiocarboxylic acid mononucleotide nickel chelatase
MRLLHLDAFAGISGDMFLGALLDLGLPLTQLQADLGRLGLKGLSVSRRRVRRGALMGTRALVRVPEAPQPHRGLEEIRRILRRAKLPPAVSGQSLAVFERLGRAEARLHGVALARIHFHEVGAWDAIADVVGVCAGLARLEVGEVRVSPVNVGSGLIYGAHGMLPAPAPATLELLRGFEMTATGPASEHTTPTGAALLAALAHPAGPAEGPRRLQAVGYGAGERNWPDFPNLLRASLYAAPSARPRAEWRSDQVAVLTANVDDVSPQILGYALERLLAAGALDVSLQPLQMKKNRPGERLEVICRPEQAEELARILFRETATLGVRIAHHERLILERRLQTVNVLGRRVRVKQGLLESRVITTAPEFEDARACAVSSGRPLAEIMELARRKTRSKS